MFIILFRPPTKWENFNDLDFDIENYKGLVKVSDLHNVTQEMLES